MHFVPYVAITEKSLSSWRAWIEIAARRCQAAHVGSLSSWRAWIEMTYRIFYAKTADSSLSSWRAWIEISHTDVNITVIPVALLMESVD